MTQDGASFSAHRGRLYRGLPGPRRLTRKNNRIRFLSSRLRVTPDDCTPTRANRPITFRRNSITAEHPEVWEPETETAEPNAP